ncbi:C2 domain-containing protein [Lipomyces kononenkoae]|uniref:C2 domain-containing protein n=1 Tax=Lipomyces kononenkoae TaxID=34357 RepID=A0ACC3TAQ5_LIPKO
MSVSAITTPHEIGTLIAVLIKAKNLPNRRRLGKQDPYCTVRIGQNAQSTKIDKRGGQRPMWNHELRFPVLESDDQMKLTILDDNDSRPELIGDSIIDLKPIFQNAAKAISDKWHEIQYRQKYAGEAYIELTFYPNKEHVKNMMAQAYKQEKQQPATPPKRRPLPASPVHVSSSPSSSTHSSPQSVASTPPPADYYVAHRRHSSSQQSFRGPSPLTPTRTNSRAGIAISSPLSSPPAGRDEANYVSRTPSRRESLYSYDPTVLQDVPAQYHITLPSDGYNDSLVSPVLRQTSSRRPLPVPPNITPQHIVQYNDPVWTDGARSSFSAVSSVNRFEDEHDYYREPPQHDGFPQHNHHRPQLNKARSYHALSPRHATNRLPQRQVLDFSDFENDPMAEAVDGLATRLEGLGRADGLGRRSTFQSE